MDYSIIVCTYNQEDRLLDRCLKAIKLLKKVNLTSEVIIVDNNSKIPLTERLSITKVVDENPGWKIIRVSEQGLVMARIAGMKEARGKYIVFVDDDNEPDIDYLLHLNALWNSYPEVGAWGPGTIEVDFVDGVESRHESELRHIFQEKKSSHVEFAMIREWQECYPYGTGMSLKKDLCRHYIDGIEEGRLTLMGRTGNRATSGDDTQMVMTIIAQGQAAGTSPSLRIKHMITSNKLEPDYLKKLAFGTSCCYHLFHVEVLPEYSEKLIKGTRRRSKSREFKLLKEFYKLQFKPDLFRTLRLIESVGQICGEFYGNKLEVPPFYERLVKKLVPE